MIYKSYKENRFHEDCDPWDEEGDFPISSLIKESKISLNIYSHCGYL